MRRIVVMDFEAESHGDLKAIGAYAYAADPTTDVMCLRWRVLGEKENHIWTPNDWDIPVSLKALIDDADVELWAFNAGFERAVWSSVMVDRYGWPAAPLDRWHCLAASAAYYGYSQNLSRCLIGTGLKAEKDAEGHAVMMALCNPTKRSKKTKANYVSMLQKLYDYCATDVDVEELLFKFLRPLPRTERDIWLMDQEINDRGIPFDTDLIDAAVDCNDQIQSKARDLLPRMTDGKITTPNQVQRMMSLFSDRGIRVKDFRAATVDKLLKRRDLPEDLKTILTIRKQAGTAAIKKYKKAKNSLVGGRFRGGFVYYGAHTGRATGKGVQPTNMPRMHFKTDDEVEEAIEAVKSRDLGRIASIDKDNPTDVLTKCVRPSITAPPGKIFVCGDFAGIELRVLTWLVGDQKSLDRIVDHGSSQLYIDMAESIFKKTISKKDTYEYTAGKSALLGLGYQMGPDKYVEMAEGYGIKIPIALSKDIVKIYRTDNPKIKNAWYAVNDAVKSVLTDGYPANWRGVNISYDQKYKALVIKIPSGRELYYPGARVEDGTIYYAGDKMGKWFDDLKLYGGLIIENIVQAIARDLLFIAMLVLSRGGYEIVSHCYDEIVIEVEESRAKECEAAMTKAMTTTPHWADGLPLGVETWIGKRYKK